MGDVGIVDGQHLDDALVGLVSPLYHLLQIAKVAHTKRALTAEREDGDNGTCSLPREYGEVNLTQLIDKHLVVADERKRDGAVATLFPYGDVETQQHKLELKSLWQLGYVETDHPLVILVFVHGQCLVDVPVAQGIASTCYAQLLTNAELGSTNLQANGLLEFRSRTELTLTSHDAIGEGRRIHIGIFRNVNPMVVHHIANALLGCKLQAVGLHQPLVTYFFVASYHTVIVVNISTSLERFVQLNEPMGIIERGHLMV